MGQVINRKALFWSQKCPVGSQAMHPIHGLCEVKRVKAFQRVIEVVIPNETTCFVANVIVDVKELKTVDPLEEL